MNIAIKRGVENLGKLIDLHLSGDRQLKVWGERLKVADNGDNILKRSPQAAEDERRTGTGEASR